MSDEDNNIDKTSVLTSDTFKIRLAKAGEAPPSLVMLVGPEDSVGRQWKIEDSEVVLGRSDASHIFIEDRSVSKSHLKLMLKAGEVSVIDLESTNKTLINDKVLPALTPYKLKNNDQIKAGNIILKFLEKGNIEAVSAAESFDRGYTDALTGINNRRALDALGAESFRKSELLGLDFSVIIFDIDHFKKVNDTYGHSAGDYVLKTLSAVVRNGLIREDDFFARSGGEEFTLVLLGSPLTRAQDIAERIRAKIESQKFDYEGTVIPITISLGVSEKKESTDTEWTEAYNRADQALYESKGGGRNKVSTK